jgi:hypothetical protein
VAWEEAVGDPVAVSAAEPVRLALGEALRLALAVGELRADRVTIDEALPEAAEESEACAEALGALPVGAADTVAEMVIVSDTSVATGESVATALVVAVRMGAAVSRTLPVATVLALGVVEGERAALRVAEGDAVAEPLPLGLPVTLRLPAAVRLALAVAQMVWVAEAEPLALARAPVAVGRLADAVALLVGEWQAVAVALREGATLREALGDDVSDPLLEAVALALMAGLGVWL